MLTFAEPDGRTFYSRRHGPRPRPEGEIAEAHGGRVSLANREGGGLCVPMTCRSCC